MKRADLWDLAVAAGVAVTAVGIWWLSPSASMIFVGLSMTAFGMFGAYKSGDSR